MFLMSIILSLFKSIICLSISILCLSLSIMYWSLSIFLCLSMSYIILCLSMSILCCSLSIILLVGLAVSHLIHLDLVLLPGQGAGGHLGPDLVRHVGISLPLDEGPWVVVVGHHHAVRRHAVAIGREANLRLQVLVVKLGSTHKHL